MPGPFINDDTPPGITFNATPRNAVIGTLPSDASVQDVADAVTDAGATMVGVFEVADPDAEAIRSTFVDAGVESLHYFGSWTYI